MRHDLKRRATLLGVAGILAGAMTWVNAQQPGGGTVAIDSDDIGGVVTSPDGPEAGVWVIAETSDLATKFVRIVVTDDLAGSCVSTAGPTRRRLARPRCTHRRPECRSWTKVAWQSTAKAWSG